MFKSTSALSDRIVYTDTLLNAYYCLVIFSASVVASVYAQSVEFTGDDLHRECALVLTRLSHVVFTSGDFFDISLW